MWRSLPAMNFVIDVANHPDKPRGRRLAQAAITAFLNGDDDQVSRITEEVLSEGFTEPNPGLVAIYYQATLEYLGTFLKVVESDYDVAVRELLADSFLKFDTD